MTRRKIIIFKIYPFIRCKSFIYVGYMKREYM